MTNKEMQCPKCKGEMVQGFVPDYFHDARSLVVAWFAGPPKKSFWSKTKALRGDGVPVGAFRCQKCGFLEFYSDAKFAPNSTSSVYHAWPRTTVNEYAGSSNELE